MRSSKTYFNKSLTSIWILALFTMVGLFLIAAASDIPMATNGLSNKKTQLAWFKGQWEYKDEDSFLQINIDPKWTYEDKQMVHVSDYCQSLIADFLLFEWQDGCLSFTQGIEKSYPYDLPRIFQIELKIQISGTDTLLIYEAVEAECQNYQYFQLKKTAPSPSPIIESLYQNNISYDL